MTATGGEHAADGEGEGDREVAQTEGDLTLDARHCSLVMGTVRDDGIEVGGATAVVEVAEDGGTEFGLPGPIPWTGRSGATRHIFLLA